MLFAQEGTTGNDPAGLRSDSLKLLQPQQEKQSIFLTRDQALNYLQDTYEAGYWSDYMHPLRQSLGQLLFFATHEKFDSVRAYLNEYPFDSLNIPLEDFLIYDSIFTKVPVIIPIRFSQPKDSVMKRDTAAIAISATDSVKLRLLPVVADSVISYGKDIAEPTVILKDTVFLAVVDTLREYQPFRENLPFTLFKYPGQGDSLAAAVRVLSDFIVGRDSSVINFKGASNTVIPVWINSKSDRMVRYWLRNEFDDSVTVWIGSMGRNTVGIFLEEGITFRRPVKQTTISDAQLTLKEINSGKLQDLNKIYVKPQYWKYRTEASFILNQASLTNWVKGGESSISTSMDITGYADYNNKELKLVSNHFARLKYGLVASGDKGVRKNLDLLETNSKLNHKAFGKFDFSAIMLFKTQIAKGFNYTKIDKKDTALLVSKFMNPATLTIGLGLDYKPNKKTSINFSPFSYKGTFVTDTTGVINIDAIDQTKYGIPKGRKSMHEPGASLQVSYEFDPFKFLNVKNRFQLFTNYINNPQNIDIDWEMIATAKINWFTEVKLNTHLIFDDDTKIPVVDDKDQPVLGPDGKQKKTARIQFKELLGFSFVFRF
jgi:hypothetical protein